MITNANSATSIMATVTPALKTPAKHVSEATTLMLINATLAQLFRGVFRALTKTTA